MSTPGSKVRLALAVLADAAIARPHADDAIAVVQHLVAGNPVKTSTPSASTSPPSHLTNAIERDDVVAVIPERRRRDRKRQLPAAGEEVHADRGAPRRRAARPGLEVRHELAQRRRIEHRAGQRVRADFARLLEHGDRERLAALLLLELGEPQRSRHPGGAAADDQDVDFEGFSRVISVPQWKPLSFFQFRNHRRHDLEQIADDPVVGDFEDRRLGVLVDRDDRSRALHADEVLNRAGDAERDIELRRHGLARTADLAIHRQPAGVADRPRRGDLGARAPGELLREREVLLPFDPAADGDDALGLRQIDGLLRFLERRLRLLPDRRGVDRSRPPFEPAPARRRASPRRRETRRSET